MSAINFANKRTKHITWPITIMPSTLPRFKIEIQNLLDLGRWLPYIILKNTRISSPFGSYILRPHCTFYILHFMDPRQWKSKYILLPQIALKLHIIFGVFVTPNVFLIEYFKGIALKYTYTQFYSNQPNYILSKSNYSWYI